MIWRSPRPTLQPPQFVVAVAVNDHLGVPAPRGSSPYDDLGCDDRLVPKGIGDHGVGQAGPAQPALYGHTEKAAWSAVVTELREADWMFSTYQPDSFICRHPRSEIDVADCPPEVAVCVQVAVRKHVGCLAVPGSARLPGRRQSPRYSTSANAQSGQASPTVSDAVCVWAALFEYCQRCRGHQPYAV